MLAVAEKIDTFAVAGPPPPLPPLDTSPLAEPTVRFGQQHVPEWGPWLLWKLTQRWPKAGPRVYAAMIQTYMNSNSAFFRKTRNACMLAVVENEPFDPQPVIREVFCFVTDKAHNPQTIELYKALLLWARSLRAKRVERCGELSDMAPQTIQANMKAAGWSPRSATDIVSVVT